MPQSLFSKGVTVLCYAFLLFLSSCTSSRNFTSEERNSLLRLNPEVRVLINAPSSTDSGKPTLLLMYALPNGNTIEMTAGKKMRSGLDWHYDIQHIAAQTRWLREALTQYNIVTAYLEADQKSWPAWRKKREYRDDEVARIVQYVRFETGNPDNVILAGHSGGGSFINGVINAYDSIPSFISRIVYLDANYSYDDSLSHGKKLIQWLKADTSHSLTVIAYDDREIKFNGKKVIGPDGGTYRATQRMMQRFREEVEIDARHDSTIQTSSAFNGRARFIIHTNPDTLILHTVLVERNGLIHSVLMNTANEEKHYQFFGERAYQQFISEE